MLCKTSLTGTLPDKLKPLFCSFSLAELNGETLGQKARLFDIPVALCILLSIFGCFPVSLCIPIAAALFFVLWHAVYIPPNNASRLSLALSCMTFKTCA